MKSEMQTILEGLEEHVSQAVQYFWNTRFVQKKKQESSGKIDQGTRSMVTGGAQMDGFVSVIREIILKSGIDANSIFEKKLIELPGYYRATKQWDILVVSDNQLLAAIELKSHVGSFGNNINNRAEEAIGSATDLWTAFREGAFNSTIKPWLGYFIIVEDCIKSRKPIKQIKEPHFKVFPEFNGASYQKRYEILCGKLQRQRLYDSCALMVSDSTNGLDGIYSYPNNSLAFEQFVRSLAAKLIAYAPK